MPGAKRIFELPKALDVIDNIDKASNLIPDGFTPTDNAREWQIASKATGGYDFVRTYDNPSIISKVKVRNLGKGYENMVTEESSYYISEGKVYLTAVETYN